MRWLMTWNSTSSALDIELLECVVRFNLNSSMSRREKLSLLFILQMEDNGVHDCHLRFCLAHSL